MVTPTTLLVSISSCRLPDLQPFARQVVEPNGYTGRAQRREVGVLSGHIDHPFSVVDYLFRGGNDGFGGEPELAEQRLVVGGLAVVLDRDDLAGVADQLVPALRDAASTATRADTAGGSTLSRYSSGCDSNHSTHGIDTTRAMMSLSANNFCASTASCSSEPVPIRIDVGFVVRVAHPPST